MQSEGRDKDLEKYWLVGELYHSGLAVAAAARHGSAVQLKGIVHEYAFVVGHNTDPVAVARKGFARLNPSSNDQVCDVLFSRAPGVQLKDTVSYSGARNTALRAADYGTVLGTHETVAAVSRHGVEIGSSGVPTAHNEAIASRVGCGGRLNLQTVVASAKIGAAFGAAHGIVTALLKGLEQIKRGEATWGDVVRDTARSGIVGGLTGAAACAAGTAAAALCPPGPLAIGVGFGVSAYVGSRTAKVLDAHI